MIFLCNYVVFFLVFVWSCSFCGKLILMLFIFYLIRKCNLIWRRWSGCVCVHACVRVLVCIQRVNRLAGDVRRQSDRERETAVLSLFLFLSLSFSPSWGTGFESECIVKQIDWLFSWCLRCGAGLPVGCFVTKHSKTLQTSSFSKLQIMPESTRFWNPFDLQLLDWHFKCDRAACCSGAFVPPEFQVFLSSVDLLWCSSGCNHIYVNQPLLLITKEAGAFKHWYYSFAFNVICRCCIQHPDYNFRHVC